VVKIFRDVLNLVAPDVSLLTETNVPHEENISYFGDQDEAHVVYQFPLPPLILHTLISGNAEHLTRWASELPPPPEGCTFLNFTASHDGVGVRPLEGIASKDDLDRIVQRVKDQGGKVSTRRQPDGTDTPYELNITFFDACGVPGEDPQMKNRRFLCSQTIPLVLQGIPAIYFNSLIAGPNFTAGVEQTQRARTINRQKWSEEELYLRLNDPGSTTATVFNAYRHLLHLRAQQPAFSPSATQAVHNYGSSFFVVERHSEEANQTIVSISNITGEPQQLELHHKIPALEGRDTWPDLISDARVGNADRVLALEPYQTLWLQV
jgi:sucrose phosphorylase